jgi:hypothetical protein
MSTTCGKTARAPRGTGHRPALTPSIIHELLSLKSKLVHPGSVELQISTLVADVFRVSGVDRIVGGQPLVCRLQVHAMKVQVVATVL